MGLGSKYIICCLSFVLGNKTNKQKKKHHTSPEQKIFFFLFLVERNLVEYSRTHMTETAAISRNTVQEEGCSSIACVISYIVYSYQ